MGKVYGPRHGSLQFWPRKKSKKMVASIGSWPKSKSVSLQGFAGYKAGMTHILLKDTRPGSTTKNDEIVIPVTVIECPNLKVFSIKLYKKDIRGLRVAGEIINPKADKALGRKLSLAKKYDLDKKLKDIETNLQDYKEIRVLLYTQPKKSGLGKKTPEVFEMGIGSSDIKSKFEYAKGLFDREIKVNEIFKSGARVDIHSITKGKGFQGVVKRFGVQLRAHKSQKKRRAAVLGPESPGKILWGMIMPGRLGFNLRTELNKDILIVGEDPSKINPKGGFLHYGLVKGNYVAIKGSIPGPCKRLVTFIEPQRQSRGFGTNFAVQYVSQESKQ